MFHEARGKYHSPERSHEAIRDASRSFLVVFINFENGVSPSLMYLKILEYKFVLLQVFYFCYTPFSKRAACILAIQLSKSIRSRYALQVIC